MAFPGTNDLAEAGVDGVERTDVLIVGGGPVGLALSIDLSWRGVRHVLIERDDRDERRSHPRMDQVGVRSMEHMRRLGVVDKIEAAGFPRDLPRDIVFETAVLGYELAREPVTCDASRPNSSFSPQKHELCPQSFFDPALQRIAEASGDGDVRYGARLTALAPDGDRVRCAIMDRESGRETILMAGFVAGCDGANSTVASLLGIGAASSNTLARSTNIFIDCPALASLTEGRRAYRHILYGPEGVWGSMVNIDGAALWRLQVLGDLEQPGWTEEQARQTVDRAIGGSVDYRIEALVPWTRRERVADTFRKGRCFLVGDAVHQFSPTGGYGMNTGLAEAFDLSWKLSAVLAGWGGEGLLESYEAERRPIAVHNARQATENFSQMRRTPGDPLVLETTPEGDMARARAGQALRGAMHDEWESLGVHLGYGYGDSPVICHEAARSTLQGRAHYQPSTVPGARAPHAPLGGGSILDLFGRGFVLLVFGREAVSTNRFEDAAERCGAPLRVERIDDETATLAYERRLVLVRPDGHVCWRGDDQPEDARRVLDRVRGVAGAAVEPTGMRGRTNSREERAPSLASTHRLCIAPMMDWTDRHCRVFHRGLTARARLYTEMLTSGAVLHGDRDRLLAFDPAEHPVALQLGGSDPSALAEAARIGEGMGYDEINLNVGCPSDRVQNGCFGACLMREPALVAECMAAIADAVGVPATVKCRLGVDEQEPEESLFALVDACAAAGVGVFVVHARKAWLEGLSPKDNREIPPLDYGIVHRLKRSRPDLTIVLNGGLAGLDASAAHLTGPDGLDGVMLGRAAYHDPAMLGAADRVLFGVGEDVPPELAVERYLPHVRAELARGTRLATMTRPLLGLFAGRSGARAWRRTLTTESPAPGAGAAVIERALETVMSAPGSRLQTEVGTRVNAAFA